MNLWPGVGLNVGCVGLYIGVGLYVGATLSVCDIGLGGPVGSILIIYILYLSNVKLNVYKK